MKSRDKAAELLSKAGITINGSNPWDIQVHDERLYNRVFSGGSLAFGEAYMDGWWDVPDLSEFFSHLLRAKLDRVVSRVGILGYALRAYFTNMQSTRHAFEVGEQHYDIGNDLYQKMLDPRMVYTCAYWSGTPKAQTLAEAQEAKLDLVCRKLALKSGDRVLDIGCGWGSFAKYAALKYGVHVTGITISKEQAILARELTKGLPVEIRVEDYRDTKGQFDHIVSLGMFEHVGPKNYRTYLKKVSELLKDEGLFLLHTIGISFSTTRGDVWMHKYIFPNGVLPSVAQIGAAAEHLFVMEDWHNFGPDYDKTLTAWFTNFEKAWPELKSAYSERFYRMWKYYLLCCAGNFRARHTQLWQIVLSKQGMVGGYKTVR